MASEARIISSLQLVKGNLTYQSQPTAFTADVATAKGPTPGAVTVTTSGTTIDLGELSALGGLCRVMNIDSTNYVEYGPHDGSAFHPMGEILPGESFVFRLSRNLLYGQSGTAETHTLRFRANTASVIVLVEAFDP